jgi:hypothetical protein
MRTLEELWTRNADMNFHDWWNSIDRLGKLITWANWGIAASLLFGFAFTVVVIKAGNRKDELADADELEKMNRIAEIEHSNLNLRSQIAGLETNAATQQERAAKAEKELLELQERIKDRHLTREQKTTLVRELSNSAKGQLEVRCPIGNPEARNFALELLEVFRASGWTVNLNDRVIITPTPVGLKLWIHSEQPTQEGVRMTGQAPERTNSVIRAFGNARVEIEPQFSPDITADNLALIVGFK